MLASDWDLGLSFSLNSGSDSDSDTPSLGFQAVRRVVCEDGLVMRVGWARRDYLRWGLLLMACGGDDAEEEDGIWALLEVRVKRVLLCCCFWYKGKTRLGEKECQEGIYY